MLPFSSTSFAFPALHAAVKQMSSGSGLFVVQDTSKELLLKWSSYTNGTAVTFSPREIKKLCWSADVVKMEAFQDHIRALSYTLPRSAIKGLVTSYHRNFSQMVGDRLFEKFLLNQLLERSKNDVLLSRWYNEREAIIGDTAPLAFSARIVSNNCDYEDVFDEFKIDKTSEFARDTVGAALERAVTAFEKGEDILFRHIFKQFMESPHVSKEVLYRSLSRLILAEGVLSDDKKQNQILDFVLPKTRFGDPRIDSERKWLVIDKKAKARVVEWLSKEDINFFFELLMKDREDKHGRKRFWLDYVPRVVRSRALLSTEDRHTHARQLFEMERKGRTYGTLFRSAGASAFLLDFDELVVVEFSNVGAIYIYAKREFEKICPNFWANTIDVSALRNEKLVVRDGRLSHRGNWEYRVKDVLARNGLRYGKAAWNLNY